MFFFYFYFHFHWKTFGSLHVWSHFKSLAWEAKWRPQLWSTSQGSDSVLVKSVGAEVWVPMCQSPPGNFRQGTLHYPLPVQEGQRASGQHSATDIYCAPTTGRVLATAQRPGRPAPRARARRRSGVFHGTCGSLEYRARPRLPS